jgi:Gluconate 2-dehydrogenase subunit 3
VTKKRVVLSVLNAGPDGGLSRRHVLQGILAATGLAVTPEAEAAAGHHAAPAASPRFLSTHQFATFEALAERIVPGARAAKVSAFVDGQLAIEGPDRQKKFLDALSHFESLAIDGKSRPFVGLDPAAQDAILEAASKMEAGAPDDDRNWGWFQVPGTKAPGPPKYSSRDHFEEIKTRVSGAYYSSEIGMRELGFTGRTFFDGFPGCTHPDGHE